MRWVIKECLLRCNVHCFLFLLIINQLIDRTSKVYKGFFYLLFCLFFFFFFCFKYSLRIFLLAIKEKKKAHNKYFKCIVVVCYSSRLSHCGILSAYYTIFYYRGFFCLFVLQLLFTHELSKAVSAHLYVMA